MDIVNAAGMDKNYGTYVDDECFNIHHLHDDDTDYDTDDDTNDDTDDDTDDGGHGNRRPLPDFVWEASQKKNKIPRTLLEVFGT